jgi:DNA-binding response OmpR family regulator
LDLQNLNQGSVSAPESEQGTRRNAGRILLVEDDEMISRFLSRMLAGDGFEVEVVHDGRSALERVQARVDLMILDLRLPVMDGIELLREVRPRLPNLPVLVLTGRSRAESIVSVLEAGADDCVNKPFSYEELLARIRALLRRSMDIPQRFSQCGDLVLDREAVSVVRGDRRIELSPREFRVLEYLMRTPRVPVSRTLLLTEVWGAACEPSTNVADVYLKYLRDKIDSPGLPKLIRTVRGTGYMVSDE